MKITAVEVYRIKGRHWPRFPMSFVEVHTDQGVTGLGEALAYKSSGVGQAIEEAGASLIDADPRQIELL